LNGNLVRTTDPLGRVTQFIYDASGNVTTFEYDGQGNLTAITDPEQNLKPPADRLKTTFTYNSAGQPLTTTDPLGNTTIFEYDTAGNLVRITDPLGSATNRTYDLVSRLIAQTDALGRTTRFSYDSLNRLAGIVDALNGQTTFGYDLNGNLLTVTDARGNTISHEYDSMDRLSRRIDQLGQAETLTYDGVANLVGTTDRKNQTTTFTYDPLNRQARSEFADGSVATLQYDAGGRLLQADDTADPHRPIAMTYDPLDRLLAETTSLGTVSYQYDSLGRRTQMTASGQTPVTYAYDANSRLRTITQAPLTPVTIDYDVVGRRTLLTLPNQVSTEYQYDAASRLTALVYRNGLGTLGDLQYMYDPAGSRTAVGGSFARTLLPDPVPPATYDAANRQLTFGSKTSIFDDTGNLTNLNEQTGITSFTWNSRNRLVGLSAPTLSAAFSYDAQGRRVQRTIAGNVTQFLYDGVDVIREVATGGDVSYLRTLAIDETLIRGSDEFFLADVQGSTVALITPLGNVATEYAYEPFGRSSAAQLPSDNPVQFTSRELDGTGLYFYRARYYIPSLGRFISQDPAGWIGGINRFAYALNSPLNFLDPFGLAPLTYDQMKEFVAKHNNSGLSDEIILAQAWKESSFDPEAVPINPKTGRPLSTARGLLQVTKPAATDVGVNHDDLFVPEVNVDAGTQYLRNRYDLVEKRRPDLTDEESRIRRALELYGTGKGYGDSILYAAKCLKGRKSEPMKCLRRIHK